MPRIDRAIAAGAAGIQHRDNEASEKHHFIDNTIDIS
jgi:hypothetical protein